MNESFYGEDRGELGSRRQGSLLLRNLADNGNAFIARTHMVGVVAIMSDLGRSLTGLPMGSRTIGSEYSMPAMRETSADGHKKVVPLDDEKMSSGVRPLVRTGSSP